jgi:hypothetical protein
MSVGGGLSSVEQRGDSVHHSAGEWTPAVHALFRHLAAVGFEGAPRPLGLDERGEILTFTRGEQWAHGLRHVEAQRSAWHRSL